MYMGIVRGLDMNMYMYTILHITCVFKFLPVLDLNEVADETVGSTTLNKVPSSTEKCL